MPLNVCTTSRNITAVGIADDRLLRARRYVATYYCQFPYQLVHCIFILTAFVSDYAVFHRIFFALCFIPCFEMLLYTRTGVGAFVVDITWIYDAVKLFHDRPLGVAGAASAAGTAAKSKCVIVIMLGLVVTQRDGPRDGRHAGRWSSADSGASPPADVANASYRNNFFTSLHRRWATIQHQSRCRLADYYRNAAAF